jgi:kynurenine formamidase
MAIVHIHVHFRRIGRMLKFYDVSLLVREGMMIYPGNPQPSIQRYASIPKDRVNESVITLGSHTGTCMHVYLIGVLF